MRSVELQYTQTPPQNQLNPWAADRCCNSKLRFPF